MKKIQKKSAVTPNPRFFLQIAVAAYFILYGIVGIAYYNSGVSSVYGRALIRVFGGRFDALSLIIAILTLIAGLILLAGLFLRVKQNILYAAGLGIFIFWAVRILYIFLGWDILQTYFLIWLEQLALDLVVLASVWLVTQKYS
jgi:hypothetical protein